MPEPSPIPPAPSKPKTERPGLIGRWNKWIEPKAKTHPRFHWVLQKVCFIFVTVVTLVIGTIYERGHPMIAIISMVLIIALAWELDESRIKGTKFPVLAWAIVFGLVVSWGISNSNIVTTPPPENNIAPQADVQQKLDIATADNAALNTQIKSLTDDISRARQQLAEAQSADTIKIASLTADNQDLKNRVQELAALVKQSPPSVPASAGAQSALQINNGQGGGNASLSVTQIINDPWNATIADAMASVEVRVKAKEADRRTDNQHDMSQGGFAAMISSNGPLNLIAVAGTESYESQTDSISVKYSGEFRTLGRLDSHYLGSQATRLEDCDFIVVAFAAIPTGQFTVIDGLVTFVINNNLRLIFQISPQIVNNGQILIPINGMIHSQILKDRNK